ncbi:hypothetical protein [Tateyamaria omphalii]|uniref:Uncharacterized protein n=1 Tax=Tateyamaria omphalii TaxID=299262 RepID=A0A1P8MRA1_9RHOB|nr:hypothetical protein [Tateyamaria omphalii]APX10600.1 hypothetical protein BWR18_01970 [Tateyamaria omphalii]
MSYFDPDALKRAPTEAMEGFANHSPAPAVVIEIARDGLSVRNAIGTVERDGTQAGTADHQLEIGS